MFVIDETQAEVISVGVATNFLEPMQEIATAYGTSNQQTSIRISSGSTGKLLAQIIHGMSHDVFFSADTQSVHELIRMGLAHDDTLTVYAHGAIVLWTPGRELNSDLSLKLLRSQQIQKVAIANPRLAPYGRAAVEALISLKVHDHVKRKIVMGENVGQTYAYVHSGNAQAGFIARSLVQSHELAENQIWELPQRMHSPIAQAAVVLASSNQVESAKQLLDFVTSEPGRAIIKTFGYRSP